MEAPSPVYQSLPPVIYGKGQQDAEVYISEDGLSNPSSVEDNEKERELLEQQRRDKALAIVADMQLTSDNLKASLRTLPQDLGRVFARQGGGDEDQVVRDTARDYATRLRDRATEELPLLPFGGAAQAQALVDAMNARSGLQCLIH